MPGKRRIIYSIDNPREGAFSSGPGIGGVSTILPPAQATPGAPTNLALTTAIERNAVTPTSLIAATWYPPPGVSPSGYLVQWSTSSVFAAGVTAGAAAGGESATISGLIPSTLYYVRVAALVANVQGDYSATASITTAADTTAPSPVGSLAILFAGGGDLVVTWTNPASANYRDAQIAIYDGAARAITYATVFNGTQRYVWTVAQNLAATSGAGDPSLYVDIWARSWGGILSTVSSAGPLTKTAPSAPVVGLIGGVSMMVATVTSTPESPYSLFEYVWKRAGSTIATHLVVDTTDTYTAQAGDEGSFTWTVTVRQRDAFGQYSAVSNIPSVTLDALTVAYLREGLIYSDSVGNTQSALMVLKDDNLVSGGIAYTA